MPSLRDLKNRIASVKSTRKITAAMKMVAASKLRRAQEQAESARPYAGRLARIMASIAAGQQEASSAPLLLKGNGKNKTHLLVVVTSDRGLCGGFNGSVVREARRLIRQLENDGKQIKILCIGRKGRDLLFRDNAARIISVIALRDARKHLRPQENRRVRKRIALFTEDKSKTAKATGVGFQLASEIASRLVTMFDDGDFDTASVVFNRFQSAMSQIVTTRGLIPVEMPENISAESELPAPVMHEFEPDATSILAELVARNLTVQIYTALLENIAGEHGARMTAMENATRNADDMVRKLTIVYNRSRQAYITKELIEIISGAEAV